MPFQNCWVGLEQYWCRVVLCDLREITALLRKNTHLQLSHRGSQSGRVETRGDSRISKILYRPQMYQIVLNVVVLTGTDTTGLQLRGCLSLTVHPRHVFSFFSLDFWLSVPQLPFAVVKVSLSSFSTSICSHLPFNSSLAPLLQPGQRCTSFQSLYFQKKIKYMKSE